MFSMFSSVTGHFTKGLVLGTLLPVLVFVGGAAPVVMYLTGDGPFEFAPVSMWTEETTAMGVIVVAITGLLYMVNNPLIRFYEGYPWMRTGLGRRRSARHRRRLARAMELQETLVAWRKRKVSDATKATIQKNLSDVSRVIAGEFPSSDLVLPTRLGNVIRSFEVYPRLQYGMSAIPLWPRLVATIDKEYGSVVDEAKSSFDFFLNTSFLATLLAALLTVAAVVASIRAERVLAASPFALSAAAVAVLAYVSYTAAIGAAASWGAQIKGAFDLYRGALLKKLGYDYSFTTRAEERAV